MIRRVLHSVDVRAVLAVSFSAVSLFLWVTGGEVSPPLLAVTCLTVGNVLGYVGAGSVQHVEGPVALPYIPETAG